MSSSPRTPAFEFEVRDYFDGVLQSPSPENWVGRVLTNGSYVGEGGLNNNPLFASGAGGLAAHQGAASNRHSVAAGLRSTFDQTDPPNVAVYANAGRDQIGTFWRSGHLHNHRVKSVVSHHRFNRSYWQVGMPIRVDPNGGYTSVTVMAKCSPDLLTSPGAGPTDTQEAPGGMAVRGTHFNSSPSVLTNTLFDDGLGNPDVAYGDTISLTLTLGPVVESSQTNNGATTLSRSMECSVSATLEGAGYTLAPGTETVVASESYTVGQESERGPRNSVKPFTFFFDVVTPYILYWQNPPTGPLVHVLTYSFFDWVEISYGYTGPPPIAISADSHGTPTHFDPELPIDWAFDLGEVVALSITCGPNAKVADGAWPSGVHMDDSGNVTGTVTSGASASMPREPLQFAFLFYTNPSTGYVVIECDNANPIPNSSDKSYSKAFYWQVKMPVSLGYPTVRDMGTFDPPPVQHPYGTFTNRIWYAPLHEPLSVLPTTKPPGDLYFVVSHGRLPEGVDINRETGEVFGTPTDGYQLSVILGFDLGLNSIIGAEFIIAAYDDQSRCVYTESILLLLERTPIMIRYADYSNSDTTASYWTDRNNWAIKAGASFVSQGPETFGAFTSTTIEGVLPEGLSVVDSGTATIGGIVPAQPTVFSGSFRAVVSDGAGGVGYSPSVTWVVVQPIIRHALADFEFFTGATVNIAPSLFIGVLTPITYVEATGALPAGLTVNGDGEIVGTVTEPIGTGSVSFTFTDDEGGQYTTQVYDWGVIEGLTITYPSLFSNDAPAPTLGKDWRIATHLAWSILPTVTGDTGALTYELISGTVPDSSENFDTATGGFGTLLPLGVIGDTEGHAKVRVTEASTGLTATSNVYYWEAIGA